MDLSTYGHYSSEWLSFWENNPSATKDGFSSNHSNQAATIRSTSNEARSEVSANTTAEKHLDQLVEATTAAATSSQEHNIPLHIYRPKVCPNGGLAGVVIYFHGGGFLLGDETTDDLVCCRIADRTGTVVVSVIYRHTDKNKYLARVDDAWDVFQYTCDHAKSLELPIEESLVLMGISAGRTLAASVILRELEESRELKIVRPLITVALLGIPWLIHIDSYPLELFKSPEVSAKLQSAEAPVIPTQRLKLFSDLLGVQDVTDSTNVIYVCLVRDFSAINAHSPHHIAINQCMYTIRSEAIHQQKTS
jgi:acetyl esterase/lipase